METIYLLTKNSSSKMSFYLNRIGALTATFVLLFSLGVTNAWAGGGGGSTYKTDFKATGGATGKGYVYASTSSTATPAYVATSDDISESTDLGGSDKTTTYYAWAKAVRGSEFASWSITGSNGGVSPTSSSASPVTVTVTSNKENGTNTGTATAQWTTYTKVDVTYNPSEDGIYSVTYQYNSYNSSDKTITAGDAENLSRNITSDNGAQTIGSYYNDVITLQSVSGELQGWYSNEACTTELTGITNNGDGTYTYVAPQSGTASVYAKYPHVDKYYGRLTASIAEVPYSMPAGGMIFISKEAAATPTYSENAQTVDNVGMGSTSLTYYLKAQPTDKRYVFRGWYSNAQCTGTPLSTNKEYTYSFTASSTNSASPTTGNIYAAFDFNLYYMEVDVQPATPGLGMVLVKDNNSGTPEYGEYSNESTQFAYVYRGTPTKTVYLYAKPKYGYKFSGWYTNPECTGTAIGTNNPQTYAATGTSTDPMNPDTTWLYAKFVEDATTVNITYNLPDQTKGEYTASVLDIQEIDDEYVWAFTEVFTSAGKTANTTQPQYKSEVLCLEAVCKAGYGVISWTEGSTTKTTPSRIYDTSGTAAKTLGVAFGDAKPFMVCSTTSATTGTAYATLREALDNLGSNKMIRVVQDAYVAAGTYIIPSGVTLYVPRAEGSVPKGTSVERQYNQAFTYANCKKYSALTLADGVEITVNGTLEVGAQLVGQGQSANSTSGNNGAIYDGYGQIIMEKGSHITMNGSNTKLFAWGRITGEGKIEAKSGATIYEAFQITDFQGGSRTKALNGSSYKIFPFCQYYIQNIEVTLQINAGAKEYLYSCLYASQNAAVNDLPYIGSSGCMFNISSGYIEKSYDKVNDRQVYRMNGNATISDFSISIYISINTANYHLPLTNNIDCYIESGKTTMNANIIMNADSKVIIREGATVEIASGKSLFVYDADDWQAGFVFSGKKIAPLQYTVPFATTNGTNTGTAIRTAAAIKDATIQVDGTLNVIGKLYTSSGNANICSTASGKVSFTNAVTDATTTVYHLNEINGNSLSSSVKSTYNTTMYPAKLQNGDGSFVMTANAAANDQFIYSKNLDKWMKNPKTITWNANGGTTEATTMAYSEGQFLGKLPAAYREGYTFDGWFDASSGGTQISQTTKVTANVTYYAHWTPKQYKITYQDQGKAEFSSTHIDEPNAHPTKHTYGTATTLNGANDKTGYDFDGWHTISNCKAESKVTSLAADGYTKDITLYAKWKAAEYTITYKDQGDEVFSGVHGSGYPQTHTYGTTTDLVAPSKTGYNFGGWYTASDCLGAAVTSLESAYTGNITLYAKWMVNQYTISFDSNGGSAVSSITQDYNTAVTVPADPTREGYTFATWTPALPGTMPAENMVCVAQWTPNTNTQYTVKHLKENLDNDDYTEVIEDRQTSTGTTGELTNAKAKSSYEGFEPQEFSQSIINADGSTVIEIHYKRLRCTISWIDIYKDPQNIIEPQEWKYGTPKAKYAIEYDKEANKEHDDPYTYIKRGTGWTIYGASSINGIELPDEVTADATYIALYNAVLSQKDVYEPEVLSLDIIAYSTIVHPDGRLNIGTKSLTTTDFVLEATPETSGELIGDIEASNVYFDFTPDGENGTHSRKWYAVAVPWEVDAATGIFNKDNMSAHLGLGTRFDVLYYDGAERLAHGQSTKCWKFLEYDADKTMIPGRLYMVHFVDNFKTIRFKKKEGASIHNSAIAVSVNSGENDDINANWNGIANPATYKTIVSVTDGATKAFAYGGGLIGQDGWIMDDLDHTLNVGQPVMVQVKNGASAVIQTPSPSPSPVRRRVQGKENTEYKIEISSNGSLCDRIYVGINDEKENHYVIGEDLVKAGTVTSRAQFWIDRYNTKLSVNTVAPVNNQADYPLSIYTPNEDEYTIEVVKMPEEGSSLYLTLDGKPIWNLSYGAYTADMENGTTNRYGLLLIKKSPQVATGVEELTIENGEVVRKVLVDDKVYIIRNGEVYSITGQLVK